MALVRLGRCCGSGYNFPSLLRIPLLGRAQNAGKSTSTSGSDLPDFKTDVNIHDHKLSRPTKPPPRRPRWEGLANLGQLTQGSLIPETLKQMEEDSEFKKTAEKLKNLGQKKMTREERKQRQRALNNLNIPSFLQVWKEKRQEKGIKVDEVVVKKRNISKFGVNIGLHCNQACSHCHVESSPKRLEMMSRQTVDRILEILKNSPEISLVDITGGAPELCAEFKYFVKGIRDISKEIDIVDRCNLTSLLEPGQEDTAEFLAENRVQVIASLPCYTAKNVNLQRGKGVFGKSIQALLTLNELGYGQPDSGLILHLVYNPLGNYLPPPQEELKQQYTKQLSDDFGVVFNDLYTMVNMPIKRFNDFLYRRNELEGYMDLLVRNYNLDTVDSLMCRESLTVNWDGQIYDCDFNGQLQFDMLPLGGAKSKDRLSVWNIDSVKELEEHSVAVDNHCFGCTAGMGSS